MKKQIRKAVPKSVRFEVFKRDCFKCQYCGVSAPDCILVIDHIEPVSKGGTNDIFNLITACESCNSGKGARKLNDHTSISKQKEQLDKIQERKEQLEMLFEWKKSLTEEREYIVQKISEFWSSQLENKYILSESGKDGLRNLLKRFSPTLIMDNIVDSINAKVKRNKDGSINQSSIDDAWIALGKFCTVTVEKQKNPHLGDAYYIRAILKKRMSIDLKLSLSDILHALKCGIDVETLKDFARTATEWDDFETCVMDKLESMTSRSEGK